MVVDGSSTTGGTVVVVDTTVSGGAGAASPLILTVWRSSPTQPAATQAMITDQATSRRRHLRPVVIGARSVSWRCRVPLGPAWTPDRTPFFIGGETVPFGQAAAVPRPPSRKIRPAGRVVLRCLVWLLSGGGVAAGRTPPRRLGLEVGRRCADTSGMRSYAARADAEARRRSAVEMAKAVLAAELVPEHRREALSIAIWKFTEADGKYNCRFRSEGALGAADPKQLQHEHVVTRRSLIARLIADPDRAADIMGEALGCIVTRDEHKGLGAAAAAAEGWARYRLAGVRVFDGAENRWLR
jgi:hypothetical protein